MADEHFGTGSGIGAPSIAAGASVIVIACIFVTLRVYTRIVTRLGLWWDDWLIIIAVLTTIATAGLILAANMINPHGNPASAGTDSSYVFTEADKMYMKLGFAATLGYFQTAGAVKLGILLMYVRIFYMSDGFRTQVMIVSVLALAHWIGCTVATLFTCRPLGYIWNGVNGDGFPYRCFNFNVFWMAAGVVELVLDIIILALPIRAVLQINLSPRRKLSVLGLFSLGGIAIITGLLKIIYAYNPNGHIPFYGPAEVWAALHTGLAIVCACLPILKPLVTDFSRKRSSADNNALPGRARRGTAETSDWNIIHLDVSDTCSNRSTCKSMSSPINLSFKV